MHGRAGHGDLMEPPQIVGDPAGAEVILLPQIEDLADDFGRCPLGHRSAARGRSRSPAWPRPSKAPLPFVVGLARNPKVAAGLRHRPALSCGVLQNLESPGYQPEVLSLRHRFSALGAAAPREDSLTC